MSTSFPLASSVITELIDINEFLPPATLQWIRDQLSEHGIHLPNITGKALTRDGSRLYVDVYIWLRNLVRNYMDQNLLPILDESLKPGGGYEYVEARGGYLAELCRANAMATMEAGAAQQKKEILLADWEDDVPDVDWALEDGVVVG